MAKSTDKRTSNLIIAGGYCLVAIIILLNYLSQASRFNTTQAKDEMKQQALQTNPELNVLKKQLEEEKKVNSEMRALLRQFQTTGSMTSAEQYQARQFKGSFEDLTRELPDLDHELLKSAFKPRPNPFIPGKNPYAPIKKNEENNNRVVSSGFPFARTLKCDPHLPFFISGANSASFFCGN